MINAIGNQKIASPYVLFNSFRIDKSSCKYPEKAWSLIILTFAESVIFMSEVQSKNSSCSIDTTGDGSEIQASDLHL